MKILGNDIEIQQGEEVNFEFLISGSTTEYIPYIVSNARERQNAYFVLTVGSTTYEKQNRFVVSFWNEINGANPMPTFYGTNPLPYPAQGVDVVVTGGTPQLPTEPSQLPKNSDGTNIEDGSAGITYLWQYTRSDEQVDPATGHKPYHYFYFDYSQVPPERVDSYECRLIFNLSSEITSKMFSQTYMYQVTLVDGVPLQMFLSSIKVLYSIPDDVWPPSVAEQLYYVKQNYPGAVQPDVEVDSPLGLIRNAESILLPSKLQVYSNLKVMI